MNNVSIAPDRLQQLLKLINRDRRNHRCCNYVMIEEPGNYQLIQPDFVGNTLSVLLVARTEARMLNLLRAVLLGMEIMK